MRNTALALLLGLGISSAAIAADDEFRSTYGAVLGEFTLQAPGSERDANQGYGGRGIFGLPLGKNLNLELTAFGDTLNRDSSSINDYQIGLGADFMLPLLSGPIRPFLLAGAGGLLEKLGTSQDTDTISPYLNGGGGLLVSLSDRLSARLEGRYLLAFNNSSFPGNDNIPDGRMALGLQYDFQTPPPAAPAAFVPPPAPVAPPPPPDGDGDGVIDSVDECPTTPPGVKVDARGCPIDTDGDGVPDYLDKCPGTPKGFKVDADGCIIEQTVVLRGVNFEFNKDLLTAEAQGILDSILPGLVAQTKLTMEIGGHTDSKGSDAYNKRLSQKRADAVRTYLIAKGVSGDRMAAIGYGEAQPIATNDTDEGRAENRRVEFKVLNKPLAVKVIKK